MQVPYSNSAKISQENNIKPNPERFAGDYKNAVQIQRSRDNRGTYDARPCAHTFKYTAKNERIKFYGISERQKCTDDV